MKNQNVKEKYVVTIWTYNPNKSGKDTIVSYDFFYIWNKEQPLYILR